MPGVLDIAAGDRDLGCQASSRSMRLPGEALERSGRRPDRRRAWEWSVRLRADGDVGRRSRISWRRAQIGDV
jgi:hypothetical protein